MDKENLNYDLQEYAKLLEEKVDSAASEISKYKKIFEESPDLFLVIDGDTATIEEANPVCETITGYTQEEIVGRPDSDLFVKWDSERTESVLDHTKMYGSVLSSRMLRKKDGSSIPVDLTINTLKNDDHNLIIVAVRDITERVEQEEQINRMNKELKALNASKDKFFSILAHDLKNLFGTLIGFSDILNFEYNELEEKEKEFFISKIFNISKNSYELLTNLLDWARSQSGRMEFNPEQFELTDVADDVLKLLSPSAEKKNITIIKDIPSQTQLLGNINMVKTILRNLVSNSIKFTKDNGEIRIHFQEKGGYAEISVIDNGSGMSREQLSALFSIEKIKTSVDNEDMQGTGLGLVLCKEFCEKHNGRIWAESTPGKGSIFTFTIPLFFE